MSRPQVATACPTRRHVLAGALLAGLAGLIGVSARMALSAPGKAHRDAHDIAGLTTQMGDMEALVHVTKCEPKELEKIGRDFGFSYQLRNLVFQYKQPDKIRMSGKVPLLGEGLLIQNGALRFYKVPSLPKKVEDLEKTPGKRLSLLEYGGILTPETLRFMHGRFVQEDTLDGHDVVVYDMTYQGVTGGSHYRVWIDPQTRISVKREWYDSDNNLRATFYYQDPHEVSPGIWLPQAVEVKNAGGVTAASTTLSDVKINQGLSDDLFAIKR